MIRLLYISSATRPMFEGELMALLQDCRETNRKMGITGMMLYISDAFVQVLEGDEEDVERLFKVIKQDSRHTQITVLERKMITTRKFADWSMGFKKFTESDLQDVEGLNRFLEEDIGTDYFLREHNLMALLMRHFRNKSLTQQDNLDLPTENVSPLMHYLHKSIIALVNVLAILMVFVIFIGVWDVIIILYQKLFSEGKFYMEIDDILETFGAFMAVLIAIEIFINITLYLRTDVIPIKLVVATALMAICRKIIVFDFYVLSPEYIYASGVVVLALGISYWLVEKLHGKKSNFTDWDH